MQLLNVDTPYTYYYYFVSDRRIHTAMCPPLPYVEMVKPITPAVPCPS